MPQPTEHKTVQARILGYAEARRHIIFSAPHKGNGWALERAIVPAVTGDLVFFVKQIVHRGRESQIAWFEKIIESVRRRDRRNSKSVNRPIFYIEQFQILFSGVAETVSEAPVAVVVIGDEIPQHFGKRQTFDVIEWNSGVAYVCKFES